MMLTNDNVFLDTNILVYSYSNSELAKQAIARKLISENNSFISTQVLQEFVNIITKKFSYSYEDAMVATDENVSNNILHINSNTTINKACIIAKEYKISFYDGLVVAAALESNCYKLYTEDLHNGLVINNQLTVINPFI